MFEPDDVTTPVETFSQARLLANLGCGQHQGFYYSEPLEAAEIDVLLQKRLKAVA